MPNPPRGRSGPRFALHLLACSGYERRPLVNHRQGKVKANGDGTNPCQVADGVRGAGSEGEVDPQASRSDFAAASSDVLRREVAEGNLFESMIEYARYHRYIRSRS